MEGPGDAERGRARVLVVAGEFGWGSAGKLQLVLEQLPAMDVLVLGSVLGGDLLGERAWLAREVPSTVAQTRQLVEESGVSVALVVGEPVMAQRLVEAGCPTVFLDSLPFLWTQNDPVAVCADTYCAQRSALEPAWDRLHKARRLVWVDSVVPVSVENPADDMEVAQRHGVVINVGGLHSPFSGDSGHHYLRAVLPPVLRAVGDRGLDVEAVCGNLSDDDVDWARGQVPHLAHVGLARPDRFDALVRNGATADHFAWEHHAPAGQPGGDPGRHPATTEPEPGDQRRMVQPRLPGNGGRLARDSREPRHAERTA